MSFENREYAKRERSPGDGWTPAVQWLVVANVVAYLLSFLATKASPTFGPRQLYEMFALVPQETVSGLRVWQVLTYAFVHDIQNPFHLIINMYMLWVAGRELEFIYGPRRFLRFYFGAALFSSLLFLALSGVMPELRHAPLLGASGAVMAVLVVYASYHPSDKILLYLIFDVPIWMGVLVMIGMDLMLVARAEGGSAAAGCYLAGAAFGFAWHRLRERIDDVLARIPARMPARAPRRIASPPSPPPAPATSSLEAELDAVLKKIHEKGMGGLTEDERGVLDRASKHYRSKR